MKNQGSSFPAGKLVRSEGDKKSKDPAVNEAYDYCRRHLRLLQEALQSQLARRQRHDADLQRASRAATTTTRSGTASRWRTATATADLHPLHEVARRRRTRTDARRREPHLQPRVPERVGRAERALRRRVRFARQAVEEEADRGEGRLADRTGHHGSRHDRRSRSAPSRKARPTRTIRTWAPIRSRST